MLVRYCLHWHLCGSLLTDQRLDSVALNTCGVVTEYSPIGFVQADKNSVLENRSVDQSSKLLVGASAVGTAALTVLSFS